jgi:hypothetical protein
MVACHHACDAGDADVADRLLKIAAAMLARRQATCDKRRRDMESIVAAYERLWLLRHRANDIDAAIRAYPVGSKSTALPAPEPQPVFAGAALLSGH